MLIWGFGVLGLSGQISAHTDMLLVKLKLFGTLMLVGSPHISYCTPEGSKVGRHHGDVDGSASHSEQHNITMKVVTS